jgi:hypothetical protein
MNLVNRYLEPQVNKDFGKGKLILILGPRQVGKTTLVKQFQASSNKKTVYYNCDLDQDRNQLKENNLTPLKNAVAPYDLVIIDEAQRLPEPGLILKILIDNFPEKNFLVTGSLSLSLVGKVRETMTGRYLPHIMLPLSYSELGNKLGSREITNQLSDLLIYGSYPNIINTEDVNERITALGNIVGNYLLGDLLNSTDIRNEEALRTVLRLLALQLGNEVSLDEIAREAHIDLETLRRYLFLLEESFVLFALPPYESNIRKTIHRKQKYYFVDLGIRNAIIGDFRPLESRGDIGGLWENAMMIERKKWNAAREFFATSFFYRSYTGVELDLFERGTTGGRFTFEMKWSGGKVGRAAKEVSCGELEAGEPTIVTRDTFFPFVGL